jgi:putative ABC transport system permease protein
VGASRQAREREYAIMRALGAGRALLAQVQRTELLGLGWLFASFVAKSKKIIKVIILNNEIDLFVNLQ